METEKNEVLSKILAFIEQDLSVNLSDYQREQLAAIVAGLHIPGGSGLKHKYFIDFLKSGPGELFPLIDSGGSDYWVDSIYEAEKENFSVFLMKVEPARAFMLVQTIEYFLQHGGLKK